MGSNKIIMPRKIIVRQEIKKIKAVAKKLDEFVDVKNDRFATVFKFFQEEILAMHDGGLSKKEQIAVLSSAFDRVVNYSSYMDLFNKYIPFGRIRRKTREAVNKEKILKKVDEMDTGEKMDEIEKTGFDESMDSVGVSREQEFRRQKEAFFGEEPDEVIKKENATPEVSELGWLLGDETVLDGNSALSDDDYEYTEDSLLDSSMIEAVEFEEDALIEEDDIFKDFTEEEESGEITFYEEVEEEEDLLVEADESNSFMGKDETINVGSFLSPEENDYKENTKDTARLSDALYAILDSHGSYFSINGLSKDEDDSRRLIINEIVNGVIQKEGEKISPIVSKAITNIKNKLEDTAHSFYMYDSEIKREIVSPLIRQLLLGGMNENADIITAREELIKEIPELIASFKTHLKESFRVSNPASVMFGVDDFNDFRRQITDAIIEEFKKEISEENPHLSGTISELYTSTTLLSSDILELTSALVDARIDKDENTVSIPSPVPSQLEDRVNLIQSLMLKEHPPVSSKKMINKAVERSEKRIIETLGEKIDAHFEKRKPTPLFVRFLQVTAIIIVGIAIGMYVGIQKTIDENSLHTSHYSGSVGDSIGAEARTESRAERRTSAE